MRASTARRVAWPIGLVSIAMIVGSLVLMFVDRHAAFPNFPVAVKRWDFSDVLSVVTPIFVPAIGIILVTRRPENSMGWLFLIAGLTIGLSGFGASYGLHALVAEPGSLPAGRALAWISNSIGPIPFFLLAVLFLLFPTGRPRSKGWRVVAWVAGCSFTLGTLANVVFVTRAWSDPFTSNQLNASPAPVLVLALVASFAACVVAAVVRFVKSVGEERLQLKWFAAAAVLELVVQFIPGGKAVSVLQSLVGLLLFVAIGVAVLKYRLYEIDVVINKAVVYGVLAAFFTAVYLAIVVGIGTAIGSKRNPFLTVIAAALIALAFNPVRDRAKRFANRLVYGKRATPYEVLSEFAERMAGSFSIEDVLPRTARMLVEGTGAVRADVWLRVGQELRAEGSWPTPPEADRVALVDTESIQVPGASRVVGVQHQGELLGALSLQKTPADPVTPTEEKLLADVASQAGLVLRNVRLIEDLRASRQRLVVAQDEERRKIERNIHDGAQQQIVALAIKLRMANQLTERDPERSRALHTELEGEVTDALENLRDLARGIYPPLLADQGLVAALQSQARKSPIPVSVDGDGIGRFSQGTEAAVYFCTLEALQNVAKYANASNATVELAELEDSLTFTVRDDGVGFDPSARGYGTGMQGMADRLAALGGELWVMSAPGEGTLIEGRVPIDRLAPDVLP